MTCYQAGHYVNYFRRIVMKFDYIVTDHNQPGRQLNNMRKEAEETTEWTYYNDEALQSVGQWHNVVMTSIQDRQYPTILLFEKADPEEKELSINNKRTFDFDQSLCS